METENEYKPIYVWKEIKHFINPTFYSKIADKEGELKSEFKVTFKNAEESISKRMLYYIPCLAKCHLDLLNIFSSLFDFMFIGHAQEKNTEGYSQITTNYNKAMDWLEENKNTYCKRFDGNSELKMSDIFKMDSTKRGGYL